MTHPSDRVATGQEPFLASAQEIADITLRRVGGELGDIPLRDLLAYGISEGIQFGLDMSELHDDPIPEPRVPLPEDVSGIVVPIELGKQIKQARREQSAW